MKTHKMKYRIMHFVGDRENGVWMRYYATDMHNREQADMRMRDLRYMHNEHKPQSAWRWRIDVIPASK